MRNFIKLIIFFAVVMNLTACVSRTAQKGSWVMASEDPTPCCEVIVNRLIAVYPPAQTTIYLFGSDNFKFDDLLESTARKAGYTIGQQPGAVNISYVIDMMDESTGYIHLKSNDGFAFSQMFRFPGYILGEYYAEQNSEVKK